MRTAVISAFVIAVGLICTGNPAAAQSVQNSVPSHLALSENPFTNRTARSGTVTLVLPDLRNTLSQNATNAFGSMNDQTKSNPFGSGRWRVLPLQERLHAQVLPQAGTCAHILIHRVWSPDSNPMIIEPKGSADHMPGVKGLPPCREDVR